jgi:hypothetical protein
VKISLALILVFCCGTLAAQELAGTVDSVRISPDTAVSLYYKFTNHRSRLYNGKEFIAYNPKLEGHPFFSDDLLHRGTVMYDGMYFDSVNMQYDLVKDELVIQHFDVFFKVVLISEKLKEFSLNNHHFKRLVRDSVNKLPVATGFYDFMHEGKTTLFIKRTKRIEETVTDRINQKIVEKDFYYIIKEGEIRQVKSLKSLLEILKDRSREIRQELRKNHIKYRRNREQAIIRAVKFYDSSIN